MKTKLSIFLAAMLIPTTLAVLKLASAQCGVQFTSCYICHDANGEMPIMYKKGVHGDHSFGYLCDYCHGGDIRSMIKDDAHKNMATNPLKYQAAACEPCHADYKERVKKYEPALKEGDEKE